MKIRDREIGPQADVYIIAELGVNHDGSVERALELTDAAAEAGADAVKLQLFRTDLLMSKAAKLVAYQKVAGETDPIAMLRRLELSIGEMAMVVDRAHQRGLHAIVTVFSVELVGEAETLPWDAYKTASPDIIHRPLLETLAATGKPLIVSTGASTIEEVSRTLLWLEAIRERVALLQCTSCYPTPPDCAAIRGVHVLRGIFGDPVGYSDHTAEIQAGYNAVFVGASILEKHLTYDRRAAGPDHSASLNSSDFGRYCRFARKTAHGLFRDPDEVLLGPHKKSVLPCEEEVRALSRQSVVTGHSLGLGHRIRPQDLTFKRPGTGLEPWQVDDIVGRQTARAVDADVPLTEADLVAS